MSPRKKTARAAPSTAAKSSPAFPRASNESWLLAGCMMLLGAQLIVAGDLQAEQGDGLLLVMFWIVLLITWALMGIRAGSLKIRFTSSDGVVLGLFALVALTSLYQLRLSSPRPAVNLLWEWLALALGYFLLRQAVTNQAAARAVLGMFVAFGTALAALGYFQYTVDHWETINRYESIKNDRIAMLRETGQWSAPGSAERKRFEDRLRSSEPLARFSLANSLAGYLAPCIVLTLGIAALRRRESKLYLGAAGIVFLALFMAGCLLLTKSRSGVLAALLGCALLTVLFGWWKAGTGRRKLIWGSAVAVVLALLVGGAWFAKGLDREVFTQTGRSLAFRVQYWNAALKIVAEHPLEGVGLGQFGLHYTRYKLPEASEEVSDPHNFLLEIAAIAGVPALLGLLGLLVMIGSLLYHSPWSSKLPDLSPEHALRGPYRFAGGGAIAGLFLGMIASLMADTPLPVRSFFLLLVVLLAALAVLLPWIRAGRLPPGLLLIGGIVLLVNLLAAGSLTFPGVAGLFWGLVAISVSLTRTDQPVKSYIPHVAYIVAAVGCLLAVMCYLTAYQPALLSKIAVDAYLNAAERGDFDSAERQLVEAVTVDPYSAQLAHQLAEFRYSQLGSNPSAAQISLVEEAAQLARERSPLDQSLLGDQGRMYLALYDRTKRPELLGQAETLFRAALEYYPASILLHASLAVTLELQGRKPAARDEATAALRLEASALAAGHADKQLPPELRQQLLRITESSN